MRFPPGQRRLLRQCAVVFGQHRVNGVSQFMRAWSPRRVDVLRMIAAPRRQIGAECGTKRAAAFAGTNLTIDVVLVEDASCQLRDTRFELVKASRERC